MFKKLDKLITKAFIGPFIATFFITLMVLVMQFFWLYIDDFVGKGLGINVILKFIWYQSAGLVPLALPLAILLSSLMTFGNLGESFELVAIKSSGISLLRFMRPLLFISVLISGIAFLFTNYIIPVVALKSRTMLTDIVYAKPAFDLREGVFFDKLSGFAIKVGKKEANDSIIKDVIVYEAQPASGLQDNFIIARSGVMRVSDNKRFLEFNLKDGWRYQERGTRGASTQTDYLRLGFKEYKKQFDMSDMLLTWTPDSVNKNNEKFFSIRQLDIAIDSLKRENKTSHTQLEKDIYTFVSFNRYLDSFNVRKKDTPSVAKIDTGAKAEVAYSKRSDSILKQAKSFEEMIPDSAKATIFQQAANQAGSMSSTIRVTMSNYDEKERILRKHKIEWHRKLVLSVSCIVLFLIGAPLGSIIRKGGLGTPLIAAISFFMVFYFSTTVGEKFAKEGSWSPFAGMWLAIFILTPIGVFLTYKAMHDSQLFNKEWYSRILRNLRMKKRNKE